MRSKKIWNSKVLSIGIRTVLFISLIFWAINSILVYLVDPHLSLLSIANVFLVVYPAMLLVASLCYCIVCYKKIYTTFLTAENKLICIIPTIYFAVSTVLIFNPINSNRNEIVQFSRVLGNGMMWNVDVSRRIVNFYLWFALFAIILGLFFLLTNYIRQIHNHPEALKMNHFIDHFSILAFCSLVLRCITYFQTDSVTDPAFNFAHSAIMLVMIISFLYNCVGLYKKINISNYLKLHFMVFSASIPIAVILHMNSSHGRVLFGIWSFLAILINFILFLSKEKFAENKISNTLSHGSIALSVFPLMTSVYIESIHILNQHKIFISHPARIYYVIVFVFMVFSLVYCIKSKRVIHNWKKISYPIIIIGIACISVQIPLSSTYNPDLFEGANAGILISDFLHFGSIPNIEHYGGHMMTSVWEAIIYAILNSDIYGAFVSPYSNMLLPILVLLFYYFVKEIWNEDAALYTVLFFPFYNYWSYFGLGMLVCLAVVAYVKKSTYMRAIVLWGAFVWCALYRLDLGFAYGFAAIVTLVTYLIYKRQKGTLKKLILSLTGWCIVGGTVWCLVCLIKQINPINRLIEFLQLNLSNQNWAYTGIGNEGNTVFAWSYLILPFLVAGCLLYSTISKSFREQTGENNCNST